MSHERLDKIKSVIKSYFPQARWGIFDCRGVPRDSMDTIYKDEAVYIDICLEWHYFEVFGLSDDEFAELVTYYQELRAEYPTESILEELS